VNVDGALLLSVFLLELVRQSLEHDAALDEVIKLDAARVGTVKQTYAHLREVHRPTREANYNKLSPVSDTSCLLNELIYLIDT